MTRLDRWELRGPWDAAVAFDLLVARGEFDALRSHPRWPELGRVSGRQPVDQ